MTARLFSSAPIAKGQKRAIPDHQVWMLDGIPGAGYLESGKSMIFALGWTRSLGFLSRMPNLPVCNSWLISKGPVHIGLLI
jgi:hypothetical protein